MPSFQIATCQTGRIATGIVQYNSCEATLLRAALFAILLYFMGGLVKHDLKRKGESGYAIIFFLTLYQQPKRTSLHTFPQQEGRDPISLFFLQTLYTYQL